MGLDERVGELALLRTKTRLLLLRFMFDVRFRGSVPGGPVDGGVGCLSTQVKELPTRPSAHPHSRPP